MPQSGTTVTVESVDHVFQTKMLDMLKQTGRYVVLLRMMDDCWPVDRKWLLDGIILIQVSDVGYQVSTSTLNRYASSIRIVANIQSFEQLHPRAVAVVIDPIQSVRGKVVVDAFRSINTQSLIAGQESRQTTSNIGHLGKPSIQALIHGLNRHYYSEFVLALNKDEKSWLRLQVWRLTIERRKLNRECCWIYINEDGPRDSRCVIIQRCTKETSKPSRYVWPFWTERHSWLSSKCYH